MNRIIIPLAVFTFLCGVSVVAFSERPWAPRVDVNQPLPFSHRVHAGINHIPCQYCHEYARRSQTSGAPPIERCVGCHGSALTGGIKPVTRAWTDHSHQPFEIRWNRVYVLPDFVRFVHRPHIWAGVACQTCHGDVQTMDRVTPVFEINMGFCIDCHTKRGATQDCFVCHH
ncbi:MAG: cytochrome c3 family protein [Candidatus Binataceae bacterium]